VGFLTKLLGSRESAAGDQKTDRSEAQRGEGRIVKRSEHFLLLEVAVPAPTYIMLLREATVSRVATSSGEGVEDAAKWTAGQLYSIAQGFTTKDEIVRAGAEIFKKAWVMRFDRASGAAQIPELSAEWEVPVFAVCWAR
jgi:hypothetical protein